MAQANDPLYPETRPASLRASVHISVSVSARSAVSTRPFVFSASFAVARSLAVRTEAMERENVSIAGPKLGSALHLTTS